MIKLVIKQPILFYCRRCSGPETGAEGAASSQVPRRVHGRGTEAWARRCLAERERNCANPWRPQRDWRRGPTQVRRPQNDLATVVGAVPPRPDRSLQFATRREARGARRHGGHRGQRMAARQLQAAEPWRKIAATASVPLGPVRQHRRFIEPMRCRSVLGHDHLLIRIRRWVRARRRSRLSAGLTGHAM